MKYQNGRAPVAERCALEMLNSEPSDQTAATMLNTILQPGAEATPKTYNCAQCPTQLILHESGIVGNSLDCGLIQSRIKSLGE